MPEREPSFFDGLTGEQVSSLLSRLPRRHYANGATVLLQGDSPRSVFVVLSGRADVTVADAGGHEETVGRVGPASSFGEMSMLTGRTATATVRASTDMDVLVISAGDFDRLVAESPQIFRNLGAILSARLARTNLQVVRQNRERVTLLEDNGAPPLLGYALASSLAWHSRRPVVCLVIDERPLPSDLCGLAAVEANLEARFEVEHGRGAGAGRPQATLIVTSPRGPLAGHSLEDRVAELARSYHHVLVQARAGTSMADLKAPVVRLVGAAGELSVNGKTAADLTLCGWAASPGSGRPDRAGVLGVPDLTPAEEGRLATGLLPPTGDGSRALGWAARHLAGLKVGVAFGAGSTRGYAHIGVIRVLQSAGVPVDFVAGASVGSAVAAALSLGWAPDHVADLLDRAGDSLFRPTLPMRSFLSNGALRAAIRALVGDRMIEDMPVPFAAVAADILAGSEVQFREGPLWHALLASMSIPGIYPPMRQGARLLVDGGVLNPVPANVLSDMGSDVTIGVKLIGTAPMEAGARGPSLLQVLLRSMDMMMDRIDRVSASAATILIAPAFTETTSLSLRNFRQGRRYLEFGETAAREALPRIGATLPWLQAAVPLHEPIHLEPAEA